MNREPEWFIKGSYVLDIIFGGEFAQDVDVFCNRSTRPPKEDDIKSWLGARGWHVPGNVQITDVSEEDFQTRDGGGEKRFNIDRLSIDMNGQLVLVDDTGTRSISICDASEMLQDDTLQLLDSAQLPEPDPPGATTERNEYLQKILRKMDCHPALNNVDLRHAVERRLSSDYEYGPEEGKPISTDLD